MAIPQNVIIMLLLSGGNMFESRKKLKEKLEETIRERDNYLELVDDYRNSYSRQKNKLFSLLEENLQLRKELEEQKQIAAKHVSMYYDVVQKLKTVMEETNYGQDL